MAEETGNGVQRDLVSTVLGLVMAVFHVGVLWLYPIDPWYFRAGHLMLCLLYGFWTTKMKAGKLRIPLLAGFGLLTVTPFLYIVRNLETYPIRAGVTPTISDALIGFMVVFTVLELTRQKYGLALPSIAIAFLLYARYGNILPKMLWHRGYSWNRILSNSFTLEAILGSPVTVAATYVYLFVLFGSLLEASGASDFFLDLALGIAGKTRGGPAKAAVVGSAMFGTISGSPTANVVGTGSFTIPMMKSLGYPADFAGGVEAAASCGGQIMPPIMGAAAFLIADTIGIPYVKVATAAIIPAALYFASVFFMVDARAARTGLKGTVDRPTLSSLLKRAYLGLPLAVLLYIVIVQKGSIIKAGLWGIWTCLLVMVFDRKKNGLSVRKLLDITSKAAKSMVGITVVCGTAGIIMGVLGQTGLGIRIGSIVMFLAGSKLVLGLILTMVVCILLGMGLPATAAYAVAAAVIIPGLSGMGLLPLQAHLFVFYFTMMSGITPPVAVASYTAAGISGASPVKTGWAGLKLGLAGFLVPFMFCFNPVLLLEGSVFAVSWAFATALIGCYAMASSLEGWIWRMEVKGFLRVILMGGALLLLVPEPMTDFLGLGVILAVFIFRLLGSRQSAQFTDAKSVLEVDPQTQIPEAS